MLSINECVNAALKINKSFSCSSCELGGSWAHPLLTGPLSCHVAKENILVVLELLAS